MAVHHVHDKFFKAVFSQPDIAAALIENLFPAELTAILQLESLELTADSYVDDDLTAHFADLVYLCQLQDTGPVQIALILEHKSYPEPQIHFQLLRYMLNHWQQNLKAEEPLVPIIPVLIYHGSSRWQYTSLESQLTSQHPALSRYVPEFDYVLIDLSLLSDERIAAFKNQFLKLSTMLMKYESRRKRYDVLIHKQIAYWLSLMSAEEQSRLIEPLARYIFETSGLSASEIIAILTPVSPQSQTTIMTAAEQIRYTTAEQVRRETTEIVRRETTEAVRRETTEAVRRETTEAVRRETTEAVRRETTETLARKMFAGGMPIEQIADFLELPIAEVLQTVRIGLANS